MGILFSKPRPESAKERRERLQKEHGVLIPPSFVADNHGDGRYNIDFMSLSTQAKLKPHSHNVLEFIWNVNPGRRLLDEYLQPGVHLSVPTTTTATTQKKGQLLISLESPTTTSSTSNSSGGQQQQQQQQQQIWVGHSQGRLRMEGWMTQTGQPSLRMCYLPPLLPNMSVAAKLSSGDPNNESSWIDAKYQFKTKSGIDCMIGGWMTGDSILSSSSSLSKKKKQKQSSSSSCTSASPAVINLQGAAEYQESIVAAHAQIPINNGTTMTQAPKLVSTLVALNLNHQEKAKSTKNHQNQQRQPPLWLTLRNDHNNNNNSAAASSSSSSSWKLILSQFFTFDRAVMNVLEDRAPKVRQTVGWVVQVEPNFNQHNNDDNNNNNNSNSNLWSIGGTWQWNRGFAIKGKLEDNGRLFKYGAILKRWEQPRVTLSILNQLDLINKTHSFLGIGLELETMPLSKIVMEARGRAGNDNDDDDDTMATLNGTGVAVPPTKIRIPKQPNN